MSIKPVAAVKEEESTSDYDGSDEDETPKPAAKEDSVKPVSVAKKEESSSEDDSGEEGPKIGAEPDSQTWTLMQC